MRDRLDGGKGKQRELIPWVCDLLTGEIDLNQDKSSTRTQNASGTRLWSIDNRRCLTHKSLWCNAPDLMVVRHPWTPEFDDKLLAAWQHLADGGCSWCTENSKLDLLR